jgi:hypothetical protein
MLGVKMNNKVKTLEQFMEIQNWEVSLAVLRNNNCAIVLASNDLNIVFLDGGGFFLWKKIKYKRNNSVSQLPQKILRAIHLTTPKEVFKALAEVKDPSSPTKNNIVDFIAHAVPWCCAKNRQ